MLSTSVYPHIGHKSSQPISDTLNDVKKNTVVIIARENKAGKKIINILLFQINLTLELCHILFKT